MSKERRKNVMELKGTIEVLLTKIEGEEKKTFDSQGELCESMRRVSTSINGARVSTTDEFKDLIPDVKFFIKNDPKVSKANPRKTATLDKPVALLKQVASYINTLEDIQGQLREVLKGIKDSKPARILKAASENLVAKLKF